jgi:hypothetical protein
MSVPQEAVMGAITGAVFAGSISGLFPVATACRKGRIGAAVVGFVLCIMAGFVGGFLTALPMAFLISGVYFFLPKVAFKEPTLQEAGVFVNPYADGRRSAFDNHFENALAGTGDHSATPDTV